MTVAVLDDHLLRDVLADDVSRSLSTVLRSNEPATTNMYLYRLCKSAVAASGGQLTGGWSATRRQELARSLLVLRDEIVVVPMREVAYRMAELSAEHRVSTLGAEAVAASEHLGARLCVWEGDDGPGIRACAYALRVRYQALRR